MNIELLLIISVIVFQIGVFIKLWTLKKKLLNVIPSAERLTLKRLHVPLNAVYQSPIQIFDYFRERNEGGDFGDPPAMTAAQETIMYGDYKLIMSEVNRDEDEDHVFSKILGILNSYLIKNKETSADFPLIKDIFERNIEQEEEKIQSLVSIPLYLGLGGTILGIIIGLFSMPAVAGNLSTATETGIDALINGVKTAMIASLMGLVLTTWASFSVRGLRERIEQKKNDIYTFIQAELLPHLSESVMSSTQSLKNAFVDFNKNFRNNISKLEGIVNTNLSSIDRQNSTIDKLRQLDLNKVASFNVMTVQALESSLSDLERLGSYISSMKEFLESTQQLNSSVNETLERTKTIEIIGNQVKEVFEENKEITAYLSSHIKALESQDESFTTALANNNESYKVSSDKLVVKFERCINQQIERLEKIADDYNDITKKQLAESKQLLETEFDELEKILSKSQLWDKALNKLNSNSDKLDKHLEASQKVHEKMLRQLQTIEKKLNNTQPTVDSPTSTAPQKNAMPLPSKLQKVIPYIELTVLSVGGASVILLIVALIKFLFF